MSLSFITNELNTFNLSNLRVATTLKGLCVLSLAAGLATKLLKKQSEPQPMEQSKDDFWSKHKSSIVRGLSALPDLWCVLSSGADIVEHYVIKMPTSLKTALSALATLNVFLVPSGILKMAHLLKHPFNHKISKNFLLIISTLGTTSVIAGLSSFGFTGLVKQGTSAYEVASKITVMTLPWAGYASRLKMPLLVKDIWRGATLANQISKALNNQPIVKPHSWKDYKSSHTKMKASLGVLQKHKMKEIKARLQNTHPNLDKQIQKISQKMDSWLFWRWQEGVREAQELVTLVQKHNFSIIKVKQLDLLAHMITVFNYVFSFTHIMIDPVLSFLASSLWLYALKLDK